MIKSTIIILTSEFPPGPGGIGNHAFNLAKWLSLRGKNVEVWTASDSQFSNEELQFDNIQTFTVVRYEKFNGVFKTYLNLIGKLRTRIEESDSIQIISSGRVPLLVGGILKMFFNKQNTFISVVHGLDINPSNTIIKQLVRYLLNKYDKIIAVSNFTASYIPSNARNKSIVINNGVDIEKFNTPFNPSHEKSTGNPSLITVGTVWERKGQVNVINSLPVIKKQFPLVHYHMVGKPNETDQIRKLAASLNVETNVSIHGNITDEALKLLLSGSDIFIMLSKHTSNGDFEGFGIAILEANSMGIPAIGSKNCGIEDAIKNDQTGMLVDPSDASEITHAISKIMNNRMKYSTEAKQHANNCSWENVIEDYLQILN